MQFYSNMNIGIKHDFLCINICWAPRKVLKPEPERQGFNTSRGAQQMLMYQKSMFDRYYCMKEKTKKNKKKKKKRTFWKRRFQGKE